MKKIEEMEKIKIDFGDNIGGLMKHAISSVVWEAVVVEKDELKMRKLLFVKELSVNLKRFIVRKYSK